MFTFVQNITSALKPYEAKAADAQMRNKGKDQARSRGEQISSDEEEQGNFAVPSVDDDSVVSVRALILFLEDYVEARLAARLKAAPPVDPNADTKSHDHFSPWLKQDHSNSNTPPVAATSRAASAYAKSSAMSKSGRSSRNKFIEHDGLQDVYGLIRDLRQLQKNNVSFITIDNKNRFLDSVFDAVKKWRPAPPQ